MKRKNGFTLIELLAVIVILAIIALIATPIILNMINDAKKSAAKDSAYGYIEAIEYNNGMADLGLNNGYTKIEGTDLNVTTLDVKVKGSKPTSGKVTITSGRVIKAELCINGYNVEYNGTATVTGSCNDNTNQDDSKETTLSDKEQDQIDKDNDDDFTDELSKGYVVMMNGQGYNSISNALQNVTNSDRIIITLLKDLSENVTIPNGKNIILNLDDYELTTSFNIDGNLTIAGNGKLVASNGYLFNVSDGANLYIENVTATTTSAPMMYFKGTSTLIINGGIFEEKSSIPMLIGTSTLDIKINNEVTMTGQGVILQGFKSLNASGAVFDSSKATNNCGAILNANYSSSVINLNNSSVMIDGVYNVTGISAQNGSVIITDSNVQGIISGSGSTITFNNSNYESFYATATAIYADSLEVNGGTFKAPTTVFGSKNFKMTNGIIESNVDTVLCGYETIGCRDGVVVVTDTFDMSGGTIRLTNEENDMFAGSGGALVLRSSLTSFKLTGGTISDASGKSAIVYSGTNSYKYSKSVNIKGAVSSNLTAE